MTDRDTALLALRPAIAADLPTEADGTVGDFLHRTLRPVLKLQNELLLHAVAAFLRDHHVPFATAPASEHTRYLTDLLGRNVKLRYTLVGLVTAMFTSAGSESAFIFRITWPRCAFTVISLIPSSPPTCLFKRPETTSAMTSRSRGVSDA